jgi:ammonia channel protein AmtB
MNTNLAAVDPYVPSAKIPTDTAPNQAGAATAIGLWYFMFDKPDISMGCNGTLAGLVAITAPCAFVGLAKIGRWANAVLEGLDVPEFGMLAYPESGDEVSAAL